MRLSISARRGWILSVGVLAAIALPTAPAAFAQDPPEIVEQPENAVVCDGGAVTFTVVAIGEPPLEYQWYRGDVAIFGADEPSYTIDPVGAGAAAVFRVVVSNAYGSVESDPAILTVIDTPPSITEQPQDAVVCSGDPVTFVVVASGDPPLEYQWYEDGVPISGATASIYTIGEVGLGQAGQYYAVVSNDCDVDGVQSGTATLVVDEPPLITVQPAPAIIAREQTNEFCVVATGTEPFEYQWRIDGVDILDATENCYETGEAGVYTCVVSNHCDEVVSEAAELTIASEVIVSATVSAPGIKLGDSATLTATAEHGLGPYTCLWSTGATAATTVVTPSESTAYTVTATDSLGQIATAEVTVVVALPLIVQTRASAYILQPGESSTLTASVITGGLVPFSFAWSTGQTTASIVVVPSVDTTYYVAVTDALGQTGSASVTITVNYETGDDQSDDEQPPTDEPGDEDQTADDGTDTADDQEDADTGDGGGDQPEQDVPSAGALCPLVSFSMISLLVAGMCWARRGSPRRRR